MDNLIESVVKVCNPINLDPNDNKPIKFEDTDGNKYTLWKNNKNGTSKAYMEYRKLEAGGAGAVIGIAYKSEQQVFIGKDGKEHQTTQRTVAFLKDPEKVSSYSAMKEKVAIDQNEEKTSPRAVYQEIKPTEKTTDWDKISWGKCKHSYLVELVKSKLDKEKELTVEILEGAEIIAEQLANMSMRNLSDQAKEKTIMTTEAIIKEFGGKVVDEAPILEDDGSCATDRGTKWDEVGNGDIKIEEIPF